MPRPTLDPATPLTELHVHLGAAVTPAIMWGIAHAQGIRLPTKDYWEFRDLITVGRRRRSFQAYLDLFHWTELIQSSPTAVERSVYEVIGGAYRKNNVTRLELRFNPMKRNRGGEQDLDHIIAAAVRGMDRAVLEYPQVRAGLIFCLDRAFDYELNEIIAAKAIAWRDRGVVAVDIAGPESPGFRFADYRDLFAQVRRAGLGVTVHAGETGGPEEVREAVEALEPTRIGHGIRSTRDVAGAGHAARARRGAGGLPIVEPEHARHPQPRRAARDHARPGRPRGAVRPFDRWAGDAPLLPPRRDRDAAAQGDPVPGRGGTGHRHGA